MTSSTSSCRHSVNTPYSAAATRKNNVSKRRMNIGIKEGSLQTCRCIRGRLLQLTKIVDELRQLYVSENQFNGSTDTENSSWYALPATSLANLRYSKCFPDSQAASNFSQAVTLSRRGRPPHRIFPFRRGSPLSDSDCPLFLFP